ncbi:MAG: hypothetical protein L6R41_007136 [Letrouitia leprolyta]|nr:MAG: hypothetical protein L6R41_007136 [Letrouitia leprolyta]
MPLATDIVTMFHNHFQTLRPMLPTYLHLLLSAILPIYTGAHASLTRPSSAAKLSKSLQATSDKDADDDEPEEETTPKIEGFSASDALWFPLLAGLTLGGLYLIIKWLEDPSILNTILNWYFALFGVLGLARMFNDYSNVATSYLFPDRYFSDGQIWQVDDDRKIVKSRSAPPRIKTSPLPGKFSEIPLSTSLHRLCWALRRSYPTICLRFHSRPHSKMHAHITPSTTLSFFAAVSIILYYNLVSRPWYLTNVLGFAFAYNAIQLISPTTSTTGSLLLVSLFVYDIYFVFYTPLMVTVATSLDIPAKLLFPRPPGPDGDPAKQHLSMLGLGDIVLPGMMIGFALRLDLYLHYLKQQKSHPIEATNKDSSTVDDEIEFNAATVRSVTDEKPSTTENHEDRPTSQDTVSFSNVANPPNSSTTIAKPHYFHASGHWGIRFWTSKSFISTPDSSCRGTQFPKPYFYASLRGYILGLLTTLYVMQVTSHAQPALLYLVPGVLLSFWLTAIYRREARLVWNFDESDKEDGTGGQSKNENVDEKKSEKRDEGDGKKDANNNGKGKKGSETMSSPPGTTTVDFLNLSVRIGITESRRTKGCLRKEQIEKPAAGTMEELIPGKTPKRQGVEQVG